MRAINLLPRDDVRRGPQKTQWVVLVPVVLAVLLAAVLSAMFLSGSGTVKDKQAELTTLQDELHAIPTPDASRVKTQTALAADKQARVSALSGALFTRDEGLCIAGPCPGQALRRVPIELVGDCVLLAEGVDVDALANAP